jgi:hypothetical protein
MLRYSYHKSTSNAEPRSTLRQLSGVASLPAKNSRQRRARIPKLLQPASPSDRETYFNVRHYATKEGAIPSSSEGLVVGGTTWQRQVTGILSVVEMLKAGQRQQHATVATAWHACRS